MEKNTSHLTELYKTAEELNFAILINNCCRELKNSSFYWGIPQYDKTIARHFQKTGHELHLKFNFAFSNAEVYVPLKYQSETLRHLFYFPAIERSLETDTVNVIDSNRFMELVVAEARSNYSDVDAASIHERLKNSIDNMAYYLNYFQETESKVNEPYMSFIDSEQKLVAGHSFHPLTKSRQGFSEEDRVNYSPEMDGRFQIHYFLIHPDNVQEESVEEKKFSEVFRNELKSYAKGTDTMYQLLLSNPSWKVVPAHPWEAKYLLQQPEVKEMELKGLLYDLGTFGPLYTATSSVRTVYNEYSDWMLKFSLHVKITSAERVNYISELYRGYHFNKFLNASIEDKLKAEHPDVLFISDPGFISVSYNGKVIDGFNTSIRYNPFKKENANKNVSLLASVCQDTVLGQPARIIGIIKNAAIAHNKPIKKLAAEWFKKYIDLILPSTVTMFEKYGFICELHQQNILLELDNQFFPSKIYLRDNQSYLFRETVKSEIGAIVPELLEKENAFIKDKYLHDLLSHYLMVSNIASLINAFGCNGIIAERELIELLYKEVERLHADTQSSFTAYLLERRHWCIKANLLTAIRNIDGGRVPLSVMFLPCPNILHKHFFSDQLIYPKGKQVFYSRYFPKEDVTISLRPIDLDRDLEMLHEWFHREHAVKIWKMDWPIQKLEAYYRSMIPGDVFHSYIGEANGEPTFNIEVYWATKDMVGDYYDVLPTDYGTHQFIAPVDPKKKFASPSTQCMVDYVFAQPEVGKMVGEGAVDSLASMMNKAHVGFKVEKVIEMPHKRANLNFCYREWYWAKFPQNKEIKITPVAELTTKV